MRDYEIIPAVISLGIWAYVIFVCIYTGVRGLRGKPISLPSRGGLSALQPVRGQSARVAGAIFLLLGLFLLIMPVIYSARHH